MLATRLIPARIVIVAVVPIAKPPGLIALTRETAICIGARGVCITAVSALVALVNVGTIVSSFIVGWSRITSITGT